MKGEVIGINSAKYASDEVEGMGFAIPMSKAQSIIENLMNQETRDKLTSNYGFLNITGQDVSSEEAANDYGDSIRFGANHSAEDEPDLTKVNFSLELFEAYTKGFLEIAGDALTPLEIETLPWGAKLMTLECGMRFLTDYLEGDHYFAVHRPGQNLDRTRTQFKLVRDMEAHWDEMNAIVRKYATVAK